MGMVPESILGCFQSARAQKPCTEERAPHEQVEQTEQRVAVRRLGCLGEHTGIETRKRHVRADPVHHEDSEGVKEPPSQFLYLENISEAFSYSCHLAALSFGSEGRYATLPPAASIFCFADSLTA